MSEEIKRKANSWITFAYRAFIGVGMAVMLKSVPVFIYDFASWQKDVEDRTLSSVEMRIDLERHMAIWSLEAQAKAFGRLGATEKAINELRKSDSLAEIDRAQMRALLAQIEINTRK